MYLIRAGAIEKIDWLIQQKGHNPHELLADRGFSTALLRDAELLLSYEKVADLLDYCAFVCDDPLFGFHLAQIQSPLVLGEFVMLLSQQKKIGDALAFAQKYIYFHARGLRFKQVVEAQTLQLQCEFDFSNLSGLQQLIQLTLGQQYECARALSPDYQSKIKIHLNQPLSDDEQSDLNHYQQRLVTGSHFNGLSYPINWVEVDLTRSNVAAEGYFQTRLTALNKRYPDDLVGQVRYLCSNLLALGECHIDVVASALNLNTRTLQRRLLRQELKFRDIVQNVRYLKAEQYLRSTRLSVTDIALNLGYAETAIFSRNFKSWSGHSPLKWRELHGSDQPSL